MSPAARPPKSRAGAAPETAPPADPPPARALGTGEVRALRARSHALKPVVTIGERGITQALLDELDVALEHHELLKVRLPAVERAQRVALGDELSTRSQAQIINRVGRILALYRKRRPQPPAQSARTTRPSGVTRRRREGR